MDIMRFLGNKTKLLEKIEFVINDNKIEGKVFCDLFSGSSSVGDFFKGKYQIISNDYLHSLSVIAKGKLYFGNSPKFETFKREYSVDPFVYLNSKKYQYNNQYFITSNYSPKGNRQFFTEENAIKIDGMRIEIEQLYKNKILDKNEYYFMLASLLESVMGVSNTTGTYEAFLKKWDRRAIKNFSIEPLEFNHTELIDRNRVYNKDSNQLLREIEGDILYIDPPYTITDYSSAYHLLESISKYDYPDIRGITGRRIQRNLKSKYNKKENALYNFEDLIRQARFSHILVSYSTQSLVPINEMVDLFKKFAKNGIVRLYEFPYREYKNIKSSKKGEDLKEIIIYFQKDLSIIKSPLNYSGSKDTIVNDIIKHLPKHVTTFVDSMGGAFNVGANIYALNDVIYNEFLPHVYELVKRLLDVDKKSIISNAEKIISKFQMKKADKQSYLCLRKSYNTTKSIDELFVLQMFCFQNQMRFNSKLEFNTPVGNCAYNETIKQRIKDFVPRTSKFKLMNSSYLNIDFNEFDKNTVFYFDPPYFITNATYNDGKRGFVGWGAEDETKLLEYLDKLNRAGYKFMLSNVIYHGDKINHLLLEWIETHNFDVYEINNVGSKNRRNEVLICNYNWKEIL